MAPALAGAAPEGKVVIAQGVDPTTLDMMHQQEQPASNVGAQIFEPLVERDQNLKIVPALAAEMPKLVAPTVWEIKLRRGRQVPQRRGLQRGLGEVQPGAPGQPGQQAARLARPSRPIDRVEIVDPYTVKVHTKKPWPVFVAHHALRQAAMYPPKEYAGKDTACISKNPIGTGPYKFVRWSKDEEIVMEAFPQLLGGARPRSRRSCSSRSPTTRCGWPRSRTARSTWR